MRVINVPRRARERSETGIYHIILRGNSKQEIFHDDEDFIRFIETLYRYKTETNMKVYGWCLMNNHVHLLSEKGEEEISATMKRIGVSYVWFYNRKYDTTGHLFQDRFKSEIIDSDKYLMTVIRYIHQNPVKARLVKNPADWKWSSCSGYYGEKTSFANLLDSYLILGMLAEDRNMAIRKFIEFNEAPNDDKCLDDYIRIRLKDEEAREEIKKEMIGFNLAEIKSLPKEQRDEMLSRIKKIEGITQRQAARILGISPNLIFKS
jgi:REP element-mobilizing transposase RayT